MATATGLIQIEEYKEVVTKYRNVDKIVLTLDKEEALSLYAMASLVGGSPLTTYRGDCERILKALRTVVSSDTIPNAYGRFSGHIEATPRTL